MTAFTRKLTGIVLAFLLCIPLMAHAQDDAPPPTFSPENAASIAELHRLPGECIAFSPDGALIATTTGLFEAYTGAERLPYPPEMETDGPFMRADFSPQGNYVLVQNQLYDTATGEKLLEAPHPQVFFAVSLDEQYVHLNGLTYETATWQEIPTDSLPPDALFAINGENDDLRPAFDFTLGNGLPRFFNQEAGLMAVVSLGIYDLEAGEYIDLPEDFDIYNNLEMARFSPDGNWLLMPDGLYSTETWERVITSESLRGIFSPDGQYFYDGERFYDISGDVPEIAFEIASTGGSFSPNSQYFYDGEQLYDISGDVPEIAFEMADGPVPGGTFSPDSSRLLFSEIGMYDLASQALLFPLGGPFIYTFNADSSLLFVIMPGPATRIQDATTGDVYLELEGEYRFNTPENRLMTTRWNDEMPACVVYGVAE